MMDSKQLIEYARKGIVAEIRKHEKKVLRGRAYLKAIDNGERVNTPLSRSQIEAVIARAKAEIKRLSDEEMELRYSESIS
jgi:hypothetical protein